MQLQDIAGGKLMVKSAVRNVADYLVKNPKRVVSVPRRLWNGVKQWWNGGPPVPPPSVSRPPVPPSNVAIAQRIAATHGIEDPSTLIPDVNLARNRFGELFIQDGNTVGPGVKSWLGKAQKNVKGMKQNLLNLTELDLGAASAIPNNTENVNNLIALRDALKLGLGTNSPIALPKSLKGAGAVTKDFINTNLIPAQREMQTRQLLVDEFNKWKAAKAVHAQEVAEAKRAQRAAEAARAQRARRRRIGTGIGIGTGVGAGITYGLINASQQNAAQQSEQDRQTIQQATRRQYKGGGSKKPVYHRTFTPTSDPTPLDWGRR